MPYFLVPIGGDAARAAGLLAVAGIQNLIRTDPDDGPVTIARVSASDAASAVDRVARALEGAFTVGGSVHGREGRSRGLRPACTREKQPT